MTDSKLHSPQHALATLLEHYKPVRLLHVGLSDLPAVDAYCQGHQCELERTHPAPLSPELSSQRYDLAVVADCLEHLPKQTGLELIGGLRNLNASRLAVLVDLQAAQWAMTDFYALAMQVSDEFSRKGQTLTLFTYDLQNYKEVPDWLNAKFWANPELFGKFWW